MKITDVNLFEISGVWTGPEFPSGDRQAHPMDLYRPKEKAEPRLTGGVHL